MIDSIIIFVLSLLGSACIGMAIRDFKRERYFWFGFEILLVIQIILVWINIIFMQ